VQPKVPALLFLCQGLGSNGGNGPDSSPGAGTPVDAFGRATAPSARAFIDSGGGESVKSRRRIWNFMESDPKRAGVVAILAALLAPS
jgi:hypothetical protein